MEPFVSKLIDNLTVMGKNLYPILFIIIIKYRQACFRIQYQKIIQI